MAWGIDVRVVSTATGPPDNLSEVRSRRLFAVVTTSVVLSLAILSYGMRLWARRKSYQRLQADDWLMGAGLLIVMEPAICEFLQMQSSVLDNGLGHHIWNLSRKQRLAFLKIAFALQRANQPALMCIKTSILLFYMRLFPTKKFKYFALANIAYTIAWGIASWFVNLTVCSPIAYYYDKSILGGTCKDQSISGVANGALSLLGDISILILPIPMIWTLHINTRRKIALCGIFLLGGFVCIASAVRIVYLANFVPTDATYTQVFASSWTFMEVGIAVISGNLPLMRPLFERFFHSSGNSNGTLPGHSQSQSRKIGGSSKGTGYTPKRGAVDADGFERISDDGPAESTQPNSLRDIELDDRAILVKKDVSIVNHQKVEGEGNGYKNHAWTQST